MDEVRARGGLPLPGWSGYPYMHVEGDSYNQIVIFILSVFDAPLRRFGDHENSGRNETETD